tara:strand:- start:420 stop:860 length:441 start_codon:yes stop_codon:yes gene_type:complete
MPIVILKNNTGEDENIEIRSAIPSQPLYLKSIAWFYDPNGATREIDLPTQTTPTITSNHIRELNLKFQFLDNIDINSGEKLKGLIPVAINNQSQGIQYYDCGFLPSQDISKSVSFSIYDHEGNRKSLNGKIYFTCIFQYNRNEVFA